MIWDAPAGSHGSYIHHRILDWIFVLMKTIPWFPAGASYRWNWPFSINRVSQRADTQLEFFSFFLFLPGSPLGFPPSSLLPRIRAQWRACSQARIEWNNLHINLMIVIHKSVESYKQASKETKKNSEYLCSRLSVKRKATKKRRKKFCDISLLSGTNLWSIWIRGLPWITTATDMI